MVKLTFLGGVNEIGGNKILVEDKDSSVFFDFGKSFTSGSEYFTSWLAPRELYGLRDYFEFNLLPQMKGLYSKEQLSSTSLKYAEPLIDAVFLSHAHFDHVDHIRFLDPKIPIYLGEGTKFFLNAMEETSGFCNYGDHEYRTFRTGKRIRVEDLEIEPIHVDHSIPSAYGFLIHTSKGTIVYTGDLRAHGPKNDMTEEFTEKAHSSESVAMICEGTRMVDQEKRKNYSENQVMKLSDRIISSTTNAVFVTHYSRDMDRFRSIYHAATKSNRKVIISPKTAYLLDRLVEDEKLDLPNPTEDENILVYYKRKKSGKFAEKDYYTWERKFMDKMVTAKYVHQNQSKIVMNLGFYQFGELINIKPDSGSHFIHSMSEPFSEEDIEDEVMHNWLNHFGIRFHQLHASGHMNKQQLVELVDYVAPKKCFPIHTENQSIFSRNCRHINAVRSGEKYII
ncbi:MAG: MBL fold metallo-hydrolase [Candidatus Bathyarchaeota archaeon]|nr:MAG: MBL fold metallo-hydrolase [Candidatus Bathyarchaeota archaeon]